MNIETKLNFSELNILLNVISELPDFEQNANIRGIYQKIQKERSNLLKEMHQI